jgi:FMN phosphatase YigB (HAD superfamily)
MPRIDYVFLDDGGVMSDPRLRPSQWEQRIGEFFPPRLGGTPEQWALANRSMRPTLFAWLDEAWARWDDATGDYAGLVDEYYSNWLTWMCAEAGIKPPESDEARVALAREATEYIMTRVRAAYPGADEAVRRLARDRVLYTASGTPSWELAYILSARSIEGLFRTLYGPDLLNVPKQYLLFYERLFKYSGADPKASLLVDDSAEQLALARKLDVRSVLVSETAQSEPGIPVIRSLAELPGIIDKL